MIQIQFEQLTESPFLSLCHQISFHQQLMPKDPLKYAHCIWQIARTNCVKCHIPSHSGYWVRGTPVQADDRQYLFGEPEKERHHLLEQLNQIKKIVMIH